MAAPSAATFATSASTMIFTNCSNDGAVTSEENFVGGIAGKLYQVTSIKNNLNTGAVTGKDRVAGIVGFIDDGFGESDPTLLIESVQNDGVITGNDYVAGLFGYIHCNSNESYKYGSISAYHNTTLKMTDSKNKGAVTSEGTNIGGLFAYAYSDTTNSFVLDCENTVEELVRYTTKTNIVDKDAA